MGISRRNVIALVVFLSAAGGRRSGRTGPFRPGCRLGDADPRRRRSHRRPSRREPARACRRRAAPPSPEAAGRLHSGGHPGLRPEGNLMELAADRRPFGSGAVADRGPNDASRSGGAREGRLRPRRASGGVPARHRLDRAAVRAAPRASPRRRGPCRSGGGQLERDLQRVGAWLALAGRQRRGHPRPGERRRRLRAGSSLPLRSLSGRHPADGRGRGPGCRRLPGGDRSGNRLERRAHQRHGAGRRRGLRRAEPGGRLQQHRQQLPRRLGGGRHPR